MNEHRVIALEGLDGSGKTTTGRMLAEQTDNTYFYCTQDNPLKKHRAFFDTKPIQLRFLYYVALSIVNHQKVESLSNSEDVFYDRTVISTIAYHSAFGLSKPWLNLVPPFLINQIDLIVYFTLDEEERIRRLESRPQHVLTNQSQDEKSVIRSTDIDREYRKQFNESTVFVSGNGKSPQQVVDELKVKFYETK
ncbi:MAG: hypothetical protein ACD_30C00109G0002 [uncultured bacterium]|uniref:Thymidylate kinase-like domain-containing protein n=3 Tax=Candidatus Daviesiibacteriota TaxID=1752718 RepID=A0A0G0H958_9BACT|nr:MAG: hypothetical protein ACD_30C00109G0002 [uncultured bacterium]KKQ08594.1 MAG: hypothetical protein US19_C0021G0010 [Candidatus Daviesbacteria bacterium GW2011_GWB1_36_5]KKQ16273.1 MAG: hypothetical protein US28_C0003G0037 [Candidatus Daviesbacteria bacterium GW2011_GWA1_36_8]OGE33140.1 MAG: hypothetical protein A3C99_03890 [Candidatus Daviesbacteria bacterium RIFCSPHIGHO2_02_FULL_37_9]OGE36739.1 MAG: hypothetical protein A3E66_02290 [Candidatus Daviesbacteria bacterium RIFCSPHIGHO2_12_FU